MLLMLALLLMAHALADFALQGDFMSRTKNCKHPVEGIPWQWPLFWHCVIHGGAVGLITNLWYLGVAEFVCHSVIDYCKCRNGLSFSTDQWLHVACKLAWVAIALLYGT